MRPRRRPCSGSTSPSTSPWLKKPVTRGVAEGSDVTLAPASGAWVVEVTSKSPQAVRSQRLDVLSVLGDQHAGSYDWIKPKAAEREPGATRRPCHHLVGLEAGLDGHPPLAKDFVHALFVQDDERSGSVGVDGDPNRVTWAYPNRLDLIRWQSDLVPLSDHSRSVWVCIHHYRI